MPKIFTNNIMIKNEQIAIEPNTSNLMELSKNVFVVKLTIFQKFKIFVYSLFKNVLK